jgi:hypothetical protein
MPPKKVRDPETVRKGDGMAAALRVGKEKGRPEKGKQPSLRSDGMKVAAKGDSLKSSRLGPIAAAKKRVR